MWTAMATGASSRTGTANRMIWLRDKAMGRLAIRDSDASTTR